MYKNNHLKRRNYFYLLYHKISFLSIFYIDLVNKGEKSFSQALDELIDIEQQNNRIRAENACVKTAAFPFIKTMDEFDFSFQPSINKKQLLELNNLGFVDKKENILFVGSSGVGKTHLARLLHHSEIVSIKGPSYRLREKRSFLEAQPEE